MVEADAHLCILHVHLSENVVEQRSFPIDVPAPQQ